MASKAAWTPPSTKDCVYVPFESVDIMKLDRGGTDGKHVMHGGLRVLSETCAATKRTVRMKKATNGAGDSCEALHASAFTFIIDSFSYHLALFKRKHNVLAPDSLLTRSIFLRCVLLIVGLFLYLILNPNFSFTSRLNIVY